MGTMMMMQILFLSSLSVSCVLGAHEATMTIRHNNSTRGPCDVTFSLCKIVNIKQELCKKIMKYDTSLEDPRMIGPALLLRVARPCANQEFVYLIRIVPEIVRSRKSTVSFTGYCHSERPGPRPSKHTNPNDTIELAFRDEASAQA